MSSIYTKQQELIQSISKHIIKSKDELDKMYSDTINSLSQPPTYNTIDSLLVSTNEIASTFHSSLVLNKTNILYWYDMNEKKFIKQISGYESKIIKEYKFKIYLEDSLFLFHDKLILVFNHF